MKAEDLKRWPLLFKKFKKNIEKHSLFHETFEEYQKDNDGDISEAFAWQDSKQGYSFWEALYSDNLVYAIFLQPKLFSIDNQVVEVNISSYELPEEVWTEHGEFLSSLKWRWLPIMPSQIDTQEAETVAWLLNLDRVRKVSYKTSNHSKVKYIVEGGDPIAIARVIYQYRCVGVQSVGMLSCSFKTILGETKQESFDYVY